MFDRQPRQVNSASGGSIDDGEEDVLKTFFERIVVSYFSFNGSVPSLPEFFAKRHLILDALSYVFVRVHEAPIEEIAPAGLLRFLTPPNLLASFHYLKLFSPRNFYADLLEGILRLARSEIFAPHSQDTCLLLLSHLAACEREAKHHSASLAHFQEATTRVKRHETRDTNDESLDPAVLALYHMEVVSNYEEYSASIDAAAAAAASRLRDDSIKALLAFSDATSYAIAAHSLTLHLWIKIKTKLAHLLVSQNVQAISHAQQALEAAERAFGDHHPSTAEATSQLADVLSAPRRNSRLSKSDSPDGSDDPIQKMFEDRNVAVRLFVREGKMWTRFLAGLGENPPLNVQQPMMISKSRMAYNQACLQDVVTAFDVAKDACIAAQEMLKDAMNNTREDRFAAFLDTVDVREADIICRKNFLKVVFVRLAYPEKGRGSDSLDWLVPALPIVLGERPIADGDDMESLATANGSCATNKLRAVSLLTRAMVSLASKTSYPDFNPKEILRKVVIGLPNSPQWKHTFRKFLHSEGDADTNDVTPSHESLQEAALNAIFSTFLERSTNASSVVVKAKQFIDCWTQQKIFDKRVVVQWSLQRLNDAQKKIDDKINQRFGDLSSDLTASFRPLILRTDDCPELTSDLSNLGCPGELIDGLADQWHRCEGLSSPEKVFYRAALSEKDLLVVSLNPAAKTTLLSLLPCLHRVDPSSPELQCVVVTKRVDVFLRAARHLDPSKRLIVRSISNYLSSISSKTSLVSAHDGSISSSSTYLTDTASSNADFHSASSSAVDIIKADPRPTHVIIARPNELRHFDDPASLHSLRIVLLDDVAAMILPNEDLDNNNAPSNDNANGAQPAHVAAALEVVKFIAKSEESQVVAMNHAKDSEYRLDADSSSFIGTILFQPEIVLLPEETGPFGDLDWGSVRIFSPFVVTSSSRCEKRSFLVQLLRIVCFERVLVIAKSCESTNDLRDALTATKNRRDSGVVDKSAGGDADGASLLHPYRVTCVDERSSERHRSEELGMFFEWTPQPDDKSASGVVMITTENEVDFESTLSHLVDRSLLIVWADWSSPRLFDQNNLNRDFLRFYVEGRMPVVYFVSPELADRMNVAKHDLSWFL